MLEVSPSGKIDVAPIDRDALLALGKFEEMSACEEGRDLPNSPLGGLRGGVRSCHLRKLSQINLGIRSDHVPNLEGKAVGGGDLSVPEAGVFYGSRLGAEVDIGEAVALGIAVGPFEVIDEAPGVVGEEGSAGGGEGVLHEIATVHGMALVDRVMLNRLMPCRCAD